ncbi:hypothetical protein BDW74DRAFT_154412 [Aspergillus multicolor]|uniref:uncharacterized protein n=1 Tax=Aspergillus multicolor TaxID=41759 RepID=UPI003CCE4FC6
MFHLVRGRVGLRQYQNMCWHDSANTGWRWERDYPIPWIHSTLASPRHRSIMMLMALNCPQLMRSHLRNYLWPSSQRSPNKRLSNQIKYADDEFWRRSTTTDILFRGDPMGGNLLLLLRASLFPIDVMEFERKRGRYLKIGWYFASVITKRRLVWDRCLLFPLSFYLSIGRIPAFALCGISLWSLYLVCFCLLASQYISGGTLLRFVVAS